MTRDKVQLRRYFLGDLSDEEMASFDLWVISDEDSRDELEAAEDELIEDYLEGNISEHDQELFHKNFLTSDERRGNLQLIASLKRGSNSERAESETSRSERLSFWDWLLKGNRPLAAAAAAVIIGIVTYIGWQLFVSKKPTALEQEYARLNQVELAVDSSTDGRSVIQLASGQLRNADKPVEIIADSLSDSVLFRLLLSYRTEPGDIFKLEMLMGDDVIFTLYQARAYSTASGSEIRVVLPKAALSKGHGNLRLIDSKDPALTQTYDFLIR